MSTQTFTHPRPGVQRWLGRAGASRWAPLPIVLAGIFMVVLDFFIVNVTLPSIQSRLHASSGLADAFKLCLALLAATLLAVVALTRLLPAKVRS